MPQEIVVLIQFEAHCEKSKRIIAKNFDVGNIY